MQNLYVQLYVTSKSAVQSSIDTVNKYTILSQFINAKQWHILDIH